MTIDRPIAIALILFIIFLLAFFLVVPEYKTFGKLRTELAEKTAEFNAEYDYYSAIDRINLDLQGRQDDIKKIDDALPKDANLSGLVYLLQKTAKENGVMIRNLFLSKSAPSNAEANISNGVKDTVFSIDLLGNYESLKKFMVSLEKSSRVFEITSISFGSTSGNFSLQIKTHSY